MYSSRNNFFKTHSAYDWHALFFGLWLVKQVVAARQLDGMHIHHWIRHALVLIRSSRGRMVTCWWCTNSSGAMCVGGVVVRGHCSAILIVSAYAFEIGGG
jgi:hypothetical protein